jgi:hypothetical protein
MSRVRECDGCGERLDWNYIELARGGHLKSDHRYGIALGGNFDFCSYECVASWALRLSLGQKDSPDA